MIPAFNVNGLKILTVKMENAMIVYMHNESTN